MSNVSQNEPGVNGQFVEPLLWRLDQQDTRELIDYAGRWAWHVYDKIVAALSNPELAAKTANLVYDKILARDGASAKWEPKHIEF